MSLRWRATGICGRSPTDERHCRATGDRDLLQPLVGCEEGHPGTIGREEGLQGVLGSGERADFELPQRTVVEHRLTQIPCREGSIHEL